MLQDTPTEAMITTKEAARLIKEARASEQDKAKAIQILAFEQGIAEGYNHGQASVMATCSDCQKVQRKKGQADLKHKETKPENACKHEWGDGHTPDGMIHWEMCVKCNVKKDDCLETKPENAKTKGGRR